MRARDSLDPSRSIWHFIAVHLRRYRETHGMSGQALGDALDCDRSTVSRYESATLRLKPAHAETVDRLWGTDGMFAHLVGFAEMADEGDWLLSLAEFERRATRIRMWEPTMIPGLLQTSDYARAALMAGTSNELDADLERRMSRKATVFDKEDPPRVTAFLSWAALGQLVGSRSVMQDQLAHLIELGALPHISIRVVENQAGAHPGLDGPIKILTVDDHDLAYDEAGTQGRFLMDPLDVQKVAVKYDSIGDIAAPIGPSRALLEAELERWT
ncbi:helix-turn-helix domain-containing protein [Actinomadura madurae]|uniref:helix-turn-helix domain-containing protein n=1 Tax=Actinomadura madurae TaxID=1993 RepID=UPI002026A5E0|nr:helix-turn-helix transcriptional regulator [Actinomadura madurae]MCP9951815.1 helix-turn-helix transcriptional regulator [Actinomadura madurae]MCP9968585.1 helix-turn-helix transcriptional regulator [Actinomadura madurae]MCP9981059.1 helix-turn-helix transcriptional regulator [Actinomadura madurae]MCQ0007444.1 helix-turn-helix transcriptional regulator [Actinomadura madurae]MCQ0017252.1 helix-turn-helix transcriptional regulator [Actinomadura madurae]